METFDIETLGARKRQAFEAALLMAKKSEAFFRHGSILFKGQKHYGFGFNAYRIVGWAWPSYVTRRNDTVRPRLFNMHAEISCMHNIPRDKILGSDIFVVRIGRDSQILNSLPCPSCQRVMKKKGVRKCFFSMDAKKIGMMRMSS